MLERLIKGIPFRKTLLASTLLFAINSCSSNTNKQYTEETDSFNFPEIQQFNPDIQKDSNKNYNDVTTIDEISCEKKTVFFPDNDGDGYGTKYNSISACEKPVGYVELSPFDCDDNNININPGKIEDCNGIDDNCNDYIDEGFQLQVWYADLDKDTHGDPNNSKKACKQPTGYVKTKDDCDDTNNKIYKITTEICDTLDNDCDGYIDENLSKDCSNLCGEGTIECINGKYTDCNAPKPQTEICNNFDDDCDGYTDEYLSKDCSNLCGEGTIECVNGKYLNCNAPKPQIEICNNLDDDCDGYTDEDLKNIKWFEDADGDGFGNVLKFKSSCSQPPKYVKNSNDCNDLDAKINPYAKEICDGIDNNCDGLNDKKINVEKCVSYDFVFVIDNSGSMDWNDKTNERYKGLNNLVDGPWKSDDHGLMVPFGSYYKVINQFSGDKYILKNNIKIAKTTNVGGGTMIGPAFIEAVNQLKNNSNNKAIILLTDGDTGDSSAPSKLNELAKQDGIQVCALGLGGANEQYLTTLSNQVGGYIQIQSANDIPKIFQNNYLALKCQSFDTCNTNNQWISNINPCGKSE